MTKDKFDSIKAKDSLGNSYILNIKGKLYLSYLGKIESEKGCKVLFFYSNNDPSWGVIEVTEHGKRNTISYKDVQLIGN